jgi:hypothetical protein
LRLLIDDWHITGRDELLLAFAAHHARPAFVDDFGAGFVVPPLQALFDCYWNSPAVYPLRLHVRRLSGQARRGRAWRRADGDQCHLQ